MKTLLCSLAPLLLAACASRATDRRPDLGATTHAQNVILFVADGAGVGHWSLALLEKPDLAVRQFVHTGFVDTRGSDHIVSGSAPGATALATGARTFMGGISIGPDSTPVETVLEQAMARGKATGLMTTTAIFDATPAAFASHAITRSRFESITAQMVRSGVNVLMGGGRQFFRPGQRLDAFDLLAEVRQRFTYVETADELSRVDVNATDALFGLFAERGMGPAAGRDPSLADMTKVAISILQKDPDGFFLMVENEETDTQAHNNEPREILMEEMLALDDAIALALEFQENNPATLIIVTSDHETGGISLLPDSVRNAVMHYSTTGHTGAWVPIFARGPGAERRSRFSRVPCNPTNVVSRVGPAEPEESYALHLRSR